MNLVLKFIVYPRIQLVQTDRRNVSTQHFKRSCDVLKLRELMAPSKSYWRSIKKYNLKVHSTTNRKPVEVLFGRIVSNNPERLENFRRETMRKIQEIQISDLTYHNKRKAPLKTYSEGNVIYIRINKRLGNKLTPK